MSTINENINLNDANTNKDEKKLEKIEKEKAELLNSVVSGNITSHKERVGYILNNFSSARNSDIDLAWYYWTNFESDIFNGIIKDKHQLYKLTKLTSLTRIRAKIQNEYKLFQADDVVKKHRKVLEEDKRLEALEDKPADLPNCLIFIDETGKNQEYLTVGSIWIGDSGFSIFKTSSEIAKWKAEKGINFEFHFAKLGKNYLQEYKDFFARFLSLNPTAGFKVIIIKNKGFDKTTNPITDLTFHLLHKGIIHENDSGRTPLPRLLSVFVDDEEEGSDKLKLENLKERISSQRIQGLYLGNFSALKSSENYYIQAIDLVASAINRKLHNKGEQQHAKDELADYILDLVNFKISNIDESNSDIDKSTVFNLR